MPRLAAIVVCAGALGTLASAWADASMEWNFVVRLDGRRVGTHRFVVTSGEGGATTVQSEAHFDVRVLGLSAYRYDHRAQEHWTGGCLDGLDARTDDDGRVTSVHAQRKDDGALLIQRSDSKKGGPETFAAPGCVMSFAYWNAALAEQHRLLDPGSGRIVDVQIHPLPAAHGWRIEGTANPIEIRWDDRRWIALDSVVGGRHLSYRLQ